MAVQFILGRSGTGKTTHCVEAIVEALQTPSEQSLVFLVPEQATYEAERAVLSSGGLKGYHRLRILSFNRLQFFLADKGTAKPSVSRIGRQMIVHKILRDNAQQLQVFRSSALLPGFARQIAETIRELHRYDKTPEDFETLLAAEQEGQGSRLSAMKFADIGLVFHKYVELIQGRFVDPDAQVRQACRKIASADFLKGAQLWVDGFASFTGAEIAMLAELLRTVDEAHVALALDPARLGRGPQESDGLFEPTERTYHELIEQIEVFQIRLRKPLLLKKAERFSGCPPLAHVEKNIFRLGAAKARAGDHIRIVSAPDLRAEAQLVAGQIRRLVQIQGYRYRDIAVVASDLGRYEHYLRAYFEDHGIPYFIDQRKPLDRHPVVDLVMAALAAVTGGFAHADVFAYLKSDLVPVTREQVDVLENYCLAFGVDERDWVDTEPWQFKGSNDPDFDEKAIHKSRAQAIGPLLNLRSALEAGANDHSPLRVSQFTRAVFAFLDELQVRQTVARWVDHAHEAGDLSVADEHRQFFDRFIDIFDELGEVFDRDEMSAEDYLAILGLAFSQMTLAFIPPSLDQVLVGSIERSRHPNLKAVFLLGATQKQFPIPVPSTGVLTDTDREVAESAGFHLAPPTMQTLAERQYLAYIAFTRPSEFLCISYPSVDEKGSPVARSHFVDELASLFEDLTEAGANDHSLLLTDARNTAGDIHNETELAEWLCSRLGRDVFTHDEPADEPLEGLLEAMGQDVGHRHIAASVVAALGYENRATLDPVVVEQLLKGPLKGSATRLATFAACPYKYFARYSLNLRPRREFKLEPLDLGNFYHAVLDALHKRLAVDGQNFADVDEDRLGELLRERIEDYASRDPFISKFRARSDHNAFIIDNAGEILCECALDLARMARAGAFRPALSEVAFGDVREGEQSLGTFELPLPTGGTLTLNGKIDRVDVAGDDGQRVALVFDYKRTKAAATFNWGQFYHGLNVQLPMYLLALSQTADTPVDRVAGAFCLPIEDAPESASIDELAQKADRSTRKAKGLFDGTYASDLDSEAGSQWSRFYNFCVTKGDQQYGRYANSGALKPDDFQRMLTFARDKIVSLAGDIVAGQIDVHPYRLGMQVACSHCDFKAVCRFDWQINDYRFLDAKGKLDVVSGGVTS